MFAPTAGPPRYWPTSRPPSKLTASAIRRPRRQPARRPARALCDGQLSAAVRRPHHHAVPTGHLVVYSFAGLPEELKAAGTMLVLDAIWRTVSNPADRRRRLVVVDEAWLLMADPQGARFLFQMAKAARKHWAGLTVVTQDAADLLGTPTGAGGRRERRHPNPAPPSPPNHRRHRRRLRLIRR